MLAKSFKTGVDASPRNIASIPFYLLISHAAELLLKSALLKRGFTETDLKKIAYRHNLVALLNALQAKGVLVSQDSVSV